MFFSIQITRYVAPIVGGFDNVFPITFSGNLIFGEFLLGMFIGLVFNRRWKWWLAV